MAKTKQDEVIKEEIIERSQAIFNNEEEFKKFDPFTYDGSYELVQTAVSLYDREQNFDNLSNEDFALLNQLSGITVSLDTYKEKVYKMRFLSACSRGDFRKTNHRLCKTFLYE